MDIAVTGKRYRTVTVCSGLGALCTRMLVNRPARPSKHTILDRIP
ncbi:hypothetical protein XF_2668 [Xylella fastidiosa 9a5c]|uniref:Uncharacterized protein n=1 Tax=Xylella fastidiosa (strain 9a5c) TaxID=160492 RepID=Q9PA52_XYLFA|nr:hypothetical protein XF_2668 [Xylella fastidiosa 9a5c]